MKRVIIFLILVCLLLAGCGMQVKEEKQISEDILQQSILPGGGGAQINNLEILRRQTNKDDKQDLVFVRVDGEFRDLEFTCQYELTYEFYDEGGWLLQEILPYCTEEWEIQCPEQERLEQDLMDPIALDLIGFTVTDVQWSHGQSGEYLTDCTVYGTLQGYNEYAQATFPFSASYVLTPNGWEYLHTSLNHEKALITPVAGVSEETVLADASAQFDYTGTYSITDVWDEFDAFRQVWYLQNHTPGTMLDVIQDVQMTYYFDTVQLCWVLESRNTLDTTYRWNIAGSWRSAGHDNGLHGDHDYELTLDIADLGDGRFQVDYHFYNVYGLETNRDGSHFTPDYSGTVYADAADTEWEDYHIWPGGSPENQYVLELEPEGYALSTLYISSEDGIYFYRSGWGSRHFTRQ